MRHPRLPLYSLRPDAEITISTGETHWTVYTDKNGFRVLAKPVDNSETSERTVLILGGTNTYGYSVNYDESFGGLLEGFLRNMHIINAAVPKYGPIQYRMVLEDLFNQGLRPDVIIVGFCPETDFVHTLLNKDKTPYHGHLHKPKSVKAILKNNIHIYRLLANIYHRMFTGGDPSETNYGFCLHIKSEWEHPPLSIAFDRACDETKRIQELAAKHSARLIYVLVPTATTTSRVREKQIAGFKKILDVPTIRAHDIFGELKIETIDPTNSVAKLPAGTTHYKFDRHLTPRTHRVILEDIRRVIDLTDLRIVNSRR